jgi:hypothetical protein
MPCLLLSFIAATLFANFSDDLDSPRTEPFVAPKYGVTTQIPKSWPLAVREKDDRVFVAVIAQEDPDRPGIAACELGLPPESLED